MSMGFSTKEDLTSNTMKKPGTSSASTKNPLNDNFQELFFEKIIALDDIPIDEEREGVHLGVEEFNSHVFIVSTPSNVISSNVGN